MGDCPHIALLFGRDAKEAFNLRTDPREQDHVLLSDDPDTPTQELDSVHGITEAEATKAWDEIRSMTQATRRGLNKTLTLKPGMAATVCVKGLPKGTEEVIVTGLPEELHHQWYTKQRHKYARVYLTIFNGTEERVTLIRNQVQIAYINAPELLTTVSAIQLTDSRIPATGETNQAKE